MAGVTVKTPLNPACDGGDVDAKFDGERVSSAWSDGADMMEGGG